MSPKITVIGGSGFIGTSLCHDLKDRCIDFEIVDLNISRDFPDYTKIADVRDTNSLREVITGDIVINLAAVHSDDVSDKNEYVKTNIDGAKNITCICQEKNIQKIIFTSSVAVYGFAEPMADETHVIQPFNEYGRTKFQAEEEFRSWNKGEQRSLIIIRPTVVFGEGNRGNVYNLIRQISSGFFVMIGRGENIKSMAYVKNLSAFIQECITADIKYGLYNYVDTPDLNMACLVSKVRKHLKGKERIGFTIPYWLGLIFGHMADWISKLSAKKMPISSIRIKKFTSTTQFRSTNIHEVSFSAPFSLEQALTRTLEHDFANHHRG